MFSAIASATGPLPFAPGNLCGFPIPLAAAEGTVYKQLVAQTGGAFHDQCTQDFDPAWPRIAGVVVQFADGFEG